MIRAASMIVVAALSGCAAAPTYYPDAYQPPVVSPGFLATAVTMPPVTSAPAVRERQIGLSQDMCMSVVAKNLAWTQFSTRMVNECLAGPRHSAKCQVIPLWMSKREENTNPDAITDECSTLLDEDGIRLPPSLQRIVPEFVAVTKRYLARER